MKTYKRPSQQPGQLWARLSKVSLRTWIGLALLIVLIPPGAIAALHVLGLKSPRPLVRFIVVVGHSMTPTFNQGDGLVFARLKWHAKDVVLADVGDSEPVVKRVEKTNGDTVHLVGDNIQKSATYYIPREKVLGRLLLRFGHFEQTASRAPERAPIDQP